MRIECHDGIARDFKRLQTGVYECPYCKEEIKRTSTMVLYSRLLGHRCPIEKHFNVGDTVKVIANAEFDHGFEIGSVVVIKEVNEEYKDAACYFEEADIYQTVSFNDIELC